MKKISIGSKPTHRPAAVDVDGWMNQRGNSLEPLKRLTIDVPLSLHQRIKIKCALRGENMSDVLRAILENHFPDEGKGASGPSAADSGKSENPTL